jgi:seryl-tRNA synthetase
MKNKIAYLVLMGLLSGSAQLIAQSKTDPASATPIINETLGKIRNVEQLDKFIAENTKLKNENKGLKVQLASLGKQVAKLTNDLKKENERMKKQLLQLPTFELKSKIVGENNAIAVFKQGEKYLRVRQGTKMSVLVKDGVWVLMHVEKISKDVIELKFPELDKSIIFYD